MAVGRRRFGCVFSSLVGLTAALWLTRQVEAQLFGLSPRDPSTLAAATTLLAVIAPVAGYVPARRAMAIDPIVALPCGIGISFAHSDL